MRAPHCPPPPSRRVAAIGALCVAVRMGDGPRVRALLLAWKDGVPDRAQRYLLTEAAGAGHDGVVRALLDGRPCDAATEWAALCEAARRGRVAVMRAFAERKDAAPLGERSLVLLLHVALVADRADVVLHLLDEHAPSAAIAADGGAAGLAERTLATAAAMGRRHIASALVGRGVSPEACMRRGQRDGAERCESSEVLWMCARWPEDLLPIATHPLLFGEWQRRRRPARRVRAWFERRRARPYGPTNLAALRAFYPEPDTDPDPDDPERDSRCGDVYSDLCRDGAGRTAVDAEWDAERLCIAAEVGARRLDDLRTMVRVARMGRAVREAWLRRTGARVPWTRLQKHELDAAIADALAERTRPAAAATDPCSAIVSPSVS